MIEKIALCVRWRGEISLEVLALLLGIGSPVEGVIPESEKAQTAI